MIIITDEMVEKAFDTFAAYVPDGPTNLEESMLNAMRAAILSAAPAIERAALERVEKIVANLRDTVWDDCESLGFTDPETGSRDCSLEIRGSDCLCQRAYEALDAAVVAIRVLAEQK